MYKYKFEFCVISHGYLFLKTHFVVNTVNTGICFKKMEGGGSKQSYFLPVSWKEGGWT